MTLNNIMIKMKYNKIEKNKLLYNGKIHGYQVYIIHKGTHIVSYISLPKNHIDYYHKLVEIEYKYNITPNRIVDSLDLGLNTIVTGEFIEYVYKPIILLNNTKILYKDLFYITNLLGNIECSLIPDDSFNSYGLHRPFFKKLIHI